MQLNQISEHVYWLPPDETTDRPVLGVIAGKNSTLVVDAGNSPAHANILLSEMSKKNIAPPTHLVLTHWHWDHVFGTAVFDTPIFAHLETKRVVEEMVHLDWSDKALDKRVEDGIEIEFCRDMMKLEMPDRSELELKTPDVSFSHRVDIDLGNVTCQIEHVGGDHAADSSVVYIPEDNIIFLSDCLYMDLYSKERSYTTKKLFPLIDKLLGYKADYYLWGHDSEPTRYVDMVEYTTQLKTIGRTVDETGNNREIIIQTLQNQLGKPLDEDDLETVDCFLAGLIYG